MTPQMLLQFLPIALKALLPVVAQQLDPNSPEGKLAAFLLRLLPQAQATMAHAAAQPQLTPLPPGTFGAAPSVQLPPQEHMATPEALLKWVETQPPAGTPPA
jgi:hypothetical protein